GRTGIAGRNPSRQFARTTLSRESRSGPGGDAETVMARGDGFVNWQHLRTFLWLRARIRGNQMKRAGIVSVIIWNVLFVAMALAAIGAFVLSLTLGRTVLSQAPALILMLVWDGILVAFLFFWTIGLLTELQRSELLSLDKFLHLPVSLNSVFLINYAGTILCPTVFVFLPAMIGLSIGLVWSRGAVM